MMAKESKVKGMRDRDDDRRRVPEARIYVANLAYSCDEYSLKPYFMQYGRVMDIYFPKRKGSEEHRGIAFIEMETEEQAKRAIGKLDGEPGPRGRTMVVRKAHRSADPCS